MSPKAETPEQKAARIKRLQGAVVALQWAQDNVGDVARIGAQVASELSGDPALPGPCLALAADADFASAVVRALDPLVVLPEPWDSLLDGITFLVALAVAGAHRLAHRRGITSGSQDEVQHRIEQKLKRLVPRHLRAAKRRLAMAEKATSS